MPQAAQGVRGTWGGDGGDGAAQPGRHRRLPPGRGDVWASRPATALVTTELKLILGAQTFLQTGDAKGLMETLEDLAK
ncbi:hypothetical protein A8B78_11690 [Jannaschia sp. EhC01]|nr:hypothetical protein A8B78_11690 [Jannaschia sp. EhC01]